MRFLKNTLAVVVATMVAMLLIGVMEMVVGNVFHLQGANIKDKVALAEAISKMPMSAFIGLLASYAIASFAGGVLATVISRRIVVGPPLVTGVLLTLSGIANLIMVQHPLWFEVISSLVYIPFAFLGYLVTRKRG